MELITNIVKRSFISMCSFLGYVKHFNNEILYVSM